MRIMKDELDTLEKAIKLHKVIVKTQTLGTVWWFRGAMMTSEPKLDETLSTTITPADEEPPVWTARMLDEVWRLGR